MELPVIEFLESYKHSLHDFRIYKERLTELEAQCQRLTGRGLDGMPPGHGSGGAADSQLAALADLRTEYEQRVKGALDQYTRVERFILEIQNPVYREILHAIYVQDVQVKALPVVFQRSREWCRYQKSRALSAAQKLYAGIKE